MDPARHRRLGALFERALAVPVEERTAFLAELCRDDPELHRELASLLEAHEPAAGYFERLAQEVVGPVLSAAAEGFGGGPELRTALQAELGDRYRIERELEGGMSRLFLAEETRLQRKVVIKVVPPDRAAYLKAEWFQREIQVAARLQHAHIVPLLTADSTASFVYYTMPFVTGESLRERLRREGALPVSEALWIWRDLLDGLAYAHAAEIVHRDIKPENVLLSERNALVTDFGIARALEAASEETRGVTAPGVVVGTPAYMAPEQVAGDQPVDPRADLYAAGLVMYEMLAGLAPFAGDSARELAQAHLTREPEPLVRDDLSAELAALVHSCLAKSPDQRPASAEALLAALATLRRPEGVIAVRPARRRVLVWGGAFLLIAALSYGAAVLARPGLPAAGSTPGPAVSLAVLPLTSRSADPGDASLADGMTEELIGALARLENLRVIASTSVFGFQGTRLDVRRIADSLRVSHVLEGSLQKFGPRLRVQLRLVRASDATTLWSETYDRQLTDVLAMQNEIGQAVARGLPLPLGAANGVRAGLRSHQPKSILAYEWYLRGLDPLLTRSDSGTRLSLDYLNRAVAADSGYAAAWAALAYRYASLSSSRTAGTPRRELLALAERAALKAVALNDSLGEAHTSLAYVRLNLLDLGAAEREIQRAVLLDPSNGPTHQILLSLYAWMERPAEALALARRALRDDPLSAVAHLDLARALILNRDCDAALAELARIATLQPPIRRVPLLAGFCYLNKEMWPEAIAELRLRAPLRGTGFLSYALARAGQRDEARQILASLLSRWERGEEDAFDVAAAYVGLGDLDRAFSWLDKSVEDLSLRGDWVNYALPEVRRDPRYARILRRVGLQNR